MADEANERLNKLQTALDPAITKFMPKRASDEFPTIAVLSQQLRAHAKGILELCDQLDKTADASEADARKAADALIEFTKRVK